MKLSCIRSWLMGLVFILNVSASDLSIIPLIGASGGDPSLGLGIQSSQSGIVWGLQGIQSFGNTSSMTDLSTGFKVFLSPVKNNRLSPLGIIQGGLLIINPEKSVGANTLLLGQLKAGAGLEYRFTHLIHFNLELKQTVTQFENKFARKELLFFQQIIFGVSYQWL